MAVNLDTHYLHQMLRSPLIVSACPLSAQLDNLKRMEDAGAGAVVLYSLFEEQIHLDQQIARYYREHPTATPADALAQFPAQKQFGARVDDYLNYIAQAKDAVSIPIIASLNCRTLGNWTDVAPQFGQVGADALELNIYPFPASMQQSAEQIEGMVLTIVKIIKDAVKLPLAVKLAPYYTNLSSIARRLDETGADALVLFNRFYQPDLDPKTLELKTERLYGTPADFRLSLHWIATLRGYLNADLAATGGIYTAEDVVKQLMVGANATLLASALYQHGIDYLRVLENELRAWLEQNDYESVQSAQGIMRQFHSRNTGAFERVEYIRAVGGYHQPPE